MRQVTINIPTPPPTPQSVGEQVKNAVSDIAAGALAEARAEIKGELAQAQAERAIIQQRLDAGGLSGLDRTRLRNDLRVADRKVEKLQEALGKIESKLTTTDGPPQTFSEIGFPQFPTTPHVPFNPMPMVVSIMAILFIGFPLALTFARLLWKRASNAPQPGLSVESTRRFDRLEQSVDAIAIEVERISENQRYLTKLLAEPKQSAKIGS